jgi:hypothetical protein
MNEKEKNDILAWYAVRDTLLGKRASGKGPNVKKALELRCV